ncbi:MAG TPA: DUF3037 domain-containing protein [Acidobacteriaceae bacterium]
MVERKQCEFQLIRYVPDAVKNEFVNIGVVLRASGGERAVRFTRDWGRVRCIDPDADTEMLEALEIEVAKRLHSQSVNQDAMTQNPEESAGKPVLAVLEDSLSNALQITEAKAFLAESFISGLEQLVSLYVDTAKRERSSKRSGRTTIHAAMRTQFERAGVWTMMRKQIPASTYTKPGDPLRIDCGYRPNGLVRMFQAVSLETDSEAAKVLAFSAHGIKQGVARVENAVLELTAIVEPIRKSEEEQPGEDRIAQYRFAIETMEEHEIRVLTTSDLPRIAETARHELRV